MYLKILSNINFLVKKNLKKKVYKEINNLFLYNAFFVKSI